MLPADLRAAIGKQILGVAAKSSKADRSFTLLFIAFVSSLNLLRVRLATREQYGIDPITGAALASRPGPIDQAIEFPLPDENRPRLPLRLHACACAVDKSVGKTMVYRTDKPSTAFMKELMRRAAQSHIQNGSDGRLHLASVKAALEEIPSIGGSLNAKLLGAADVTSTAVD